MSLRGAVNAKCKDCIYDPMGDGNWRQQVTACTSTDCPLYTVRPTSKPRVERGAKSAAQSTEDSTADGPGG